MSRPFHHGISEFALFVLKETRGQAILAGCMVKVHDVKPNPQKGPGWFEVQVSGVNSTSVYWMDVTTEEYAKQQSQAYHAQRMRKNARKLREWPN